MGSLRERAKRVLARTTVLAAALRHPRTPWYAKAVGTLTLLYAVSPVDLIPDFIPVLGLLDDILLVPAGIWLTARMIPRDVWLECEARSAREGGPVPEGWRSVLLVVATWVVLLVVAAVVLRKVL